MSHAFSPPAGGHRRRAGRLTAAVVLIALLVALAAAAEASAAPLRWRDCGERGLQCTSLRVPLNYAKPRGAQITIGLNRLRALDRKRRVGSLIYNPGGPGGAATRAARDRGDGPALLHGGHAEPLRHHRHGSPRRRQ